MSEPSWEVQTLKFILALHAVLAVAGIMIYELWVLFGHLFS